MTATAAGSWLRASHSTYFRSVSTSVLTDDHHIRAWALQDANTNDRMLMQPTPRKMCVGPYHPFGAKHQHPPLTSPFMVRVTWRTLAGLLCDIWRLNRSEGPIFLLD